MTKKLKPYIFEDREKLIEILKSQDIQELANSFFSERVFSITSAACAGVLGNTYRAFRNLPLKPSVVFREWTTKSIEDSLPRIILANDINSYGDYVHEATLELEQHWRERTNSEMGYGRGAKLLNLVLKKLACYSKISEEQRNQLIDLLHVPLDSFTIVGLRSIAPELKIPKSATMKFVVDPAHYRAFQSLIFDITSEAGVPPIYYEILAWDRAH